MQISLLLFEISPANSKCSYSYHQKQMLCLVTYCDAQTSISAIANSNIGKWEVKTKRSLRQQHMLDHQGPDVLCAVPVLQQRAISSDACLDAPAICTSNTYCRTIRTSIFRKCCSALMLIEWYLLFTTGVRSKSSAYNMHRCSMAHV